MDMQTVIIQTKILLCGIDHGFSTMKTAHFVFENGVKELGGEATLATKTMILNNRSYKVGEGRLPLKDTKVEDEDYFLLTLAAIAKEMDYYQLTDASVSIAAGLPFTRFGQEKAEFMKYLNPGDRNFQYNGKAYHISCGEMFLYPQCYAAVADRLGKLPAELLIVDIGSKTVDIIHTRKHIPVESDCITIPSALIQCMANINNVVYRKMNRTLTEEQIQQVMMYGNAQYSDKMVQIVKEELEAFARGIEATLAEKKRFSYGLAYLYEQIRKMNELQEEYLVIVKYDVKSFVDLFRLKQRLQHVDEELCRTQKEMYRDRAVLKRSCKTAEDIASFEESEEDYRKRLEQVKLQKKDIRNKLKAVERCIGRDGSLFEAELELRIPVEELDEITAMHKVGVSENPYREQVIDDISGGEDPVKVNFEDVMSGDLDEDMEKVAEEAVNDTAEIVTAKEDVASMESDAVTDFTDKTDELPSDKAEYMRLSVKEKVCAFGFDTKGTDKAFDMVKAYFESVGMDAGFNAIYEETKLLTDYCEKVVEERQISEKVEQILQRLDAWNIGPEQLLVYPKYILSEVFDLQDMDYYTGIKVFGAVLDRKEVHLESQEKYELFEKIYEEEMREEKRENTKGGR